MDIGNLFKQLEEDSRVLILSAIFCFPVAYLDCWRLSLHFQQIDLIPQIILACGVGMLMALAGIFFNMIFLVLANNVEVGINTASVLLPSFVTSFCCILNSWNFIGFTLYFAGWCAVSLVFAIVMRAAKKRHKK